jgi:AraC-like DNA-binding protein
MNLSGTGAALLKSGSNERIHPATKLLTIVESLESEGVSPTDALRGIQIAPAALVAPSTRVSFNQTIAACRNAVRLSRDPHFAVHAGLRLHITAYGMYGFAILSSVTFRQAIKVALQYHALATPLFDISFREEHGRAEWTLSSLMHPRIDLALNRFLVELELASLLRVHRDVMGAAFAAKRVEVTFAAPRGASIHAQMFGCPVQFGRAENKLVFDAVGLDEKPQLGNPITFGEVVNCCDFLMDQMRLRVGMSGKVREVLLHNVMSPMRLEAVAMRLHMTPRTLRRRLHQERTSFRRLADDLRKRIAAKYVGETDLSMEHVAHALGFSDDASFRRAFRRWTKSGPREFRTRLRSVGAAGLPSTPRTKRFEAGRLRKSR